ncbi:hypothetical protein M8C21_011255 [Ambrosia artemisiifolia]|uniref:Eukaryotic translation initiation factor 3 subunit B n=1 Tax=Ambrosia artemisiifolia TaxID=4212 RepID=A0AAD5D1V1_AMBAR|nr:hypothetical protein M8C21_011255 [Ambrosia artemisiifolia]
MVGVMSMSLDDIITESSRFNIGSVILPPGEDFGIKSDDEDVYEDESLECDAGFRSVIVVDNLPVVPQKKFDRLEAVVRRRFSRFGVVKENGLWMPVEEDTGKTLGYCFIEYNTPQENLQRWLVDEKGRDQFVIRSGSETEWSPLGTYLATVHRQGAAVWGGASIFNQLMRYVHPQVLVIMLFLFPVKLIDFSPGEKYLVTCSSHELSQPCDTHRVVLNIFDVRTGKVMKEFKESADEFAFGEMGVIFSLHICVTGVDMHVPLRLCRWSGGNEDKYFARLGKNVISVYETKTFNLIDTKSIKAENVMDFCWSPTDSIIAFFVPELSCGNQPARMSLFQIPSKVELRQKNLFSVNDCKMHWQSNGEYLVVKVDRYTKTKKNTYTGFELFRIKERDIPIETFELDNKNDKVISFAWEPKGHRFAVIHGDNPRPDVSFYSVKGGKVSKLTTLKQKQANALFWSPGGRFIILAGLKGFNGQLEFYNVDELVTIATAEHFMATNVEWDPTGRYVATAVTSVHEMENGFNIWTLNGKLLYHIPKEHFFQYHIKMSIPESYNDEKHVQFAWRPRPASLLSPEKEEEILKNLKKYSKKYEMEDEDISVLLSEQEREKRKRLKEEWELWVNEWKSYQEEHMLRDIEASDVEDDTQVEVEEMLDVTEEILPDVSVF